MYFFFFSKKEVRRAKYYLRPNIFNKIINLLQCSLDKTLTGSTSAVWLKLKHTRQRLTDMSAFK